MTLVERLEKATGASRELDMEIATAVGHTPGPPNFDLTSPRRYTESIDAALTLVQDKWKHSTSGERGAWGTCVLFPPDYDPRTKEGSGEVHLSSAKSAALAICAAALRARQHGEG